MSFNPYDGCATADEYVLLKQDDCYQVAARE
ncbi:hypothetical protein M2396_004063 [Pseudomonas sp. BIGb0278]|nr:hypothetical protein [Pseudomonas sp. BIGb0278]